MGFSLMEIVIVLAIVGIVATIAVPRDVSSLTRYRVDAAARRIAADLELARQAARQANQSRMVRFDPAVSTYEIRDVMAMNGSVGDYNADLAQQPYAVQVTSVDFNGDPEVVFDGHGVPDSGGTVVVCAGADQKTVLLDANTGEVKIQ